MKRLILLGLIVVLAGSNLLTGCTSSGEKVAAPDFSLRGLDGGTYTLSEQEGKMVVLYFWAASCPPCVAKLPALAAMEENLPENVELWLVNLRDGEDSIRPLVREYPNLTVLQNGVAAFLEYKFRFTPTVAFIGPGGDLVYSEAGMTMERIVAKINELAGN